MVDEVKSDVPAVETPAPVEAAPATDAATADKAGASAEKVKVKWTDPEGIFGMLSDKTVTAEGKNVGGFAATIRHNFNPSAAGNSATKVFGRAVGTGVGVYMMADSLRSKKADGEERGAAGRVLEFVAGGGIGVASALTGKALHLRGV